MKKIVSLILFFVFSFFGLAVAGENTQISIAPPPIPDPIFEKGEKSFKLDLSFISMSGDDFTAGGAGVDAKGRYAFSNYIAIDYGIGVFGLSGTFENDSSDSDLNYVDVPMSVNLEIQPYKNDFFSIILFTGPTFEVISMTMEMNSAYYDADYEATETYGGFQAGMQLGIKGGSFLFSPFVMIAEKSGSGTSTTTSSYNGYETETEEDYDIESMSLVSMGIDVEYLPWGLTLSAILQAADVAREESSQEDEDSNVETFIFRIGWVW